MKTPGAELILDCVRKVVQPVGAGFTDGQLLRHYVTRRDEGAFAILVRRHGPMVLAVCRRMLRHTEDAEDAFQATFVILARKGHRIAGRQTLGGWLHGVACRVALDVRRQKARRQAKEHQVKDMPHPPVLPEERSHDMLGVLDRELARLPDKYRLPVILCELQGRSRKEAAEHLGLPEGTLSSRLAAARKTLARRMAGYGAAVTAASLEALFASEAGAACVPAPLLSSTVRAAGGALPASVAALAEGVLKAMFLAKIKPTALTLLVAVCLGAGAITLSFAAAAEPGQKGDRSSSAARTDRNDLEALRLEIEALRVSLQATRERVKALEADAEAQKEQAVETSRKANRQIPAMTEKHLASAEDLLRQIYTAPAPKTAISPAAKEIMPPVVDPLVANFISPGVKPTGEVAKAAANLRAAAAKVALDPTNEQALDALKQALEQMNRQAKPKRANEPRTK